MNLLTGFAAMVLLGPLSAWAQISPAQDPSLRSYGQPATPKVVAYVQMALQQGDLQSAEAIVAQYRKLFGDTPEALEAFSWLARGELAARNTGQALKDAEEIERISRASLATRKMDAEPHLPLALGAAYEVQAQALYEAGKRAEALQLLQSALKTWRGTSLVDRLQKNINLMTLQGKPMPALRETEWIGRKPQPPSARRGKVLLLFFWAHWCADCKAEAPIISKLAAEFEPKGLVVIAPTRLYGYTAQEEHAQPSVELPFIEKVYQKYYSTIPNAQVPVDSGNFQRFGASTTPTIVLVDRQGIVRLYNPGAMEEAALRSAIESLVAKQASERAAR
jgi:thiol-disulfide isomerase/thioredoxin